MTDIPVEKVIGYENTVISKLFIKQNSVFNGGFSAGTDRKCMAMGFVKIH